SVLDPSVSDPAVLDPAAFGFAVTKGAVAGYVQDSLCATCHIELFESYQAVGMAQSFARPAHAVVVEDFEAPPYYHPASNRYYEMRRTAAGGLVMARWQLDAAGRPVHRVEQEVDWVMGSGHTSRVYLYQTAGGELFQLPLAWYSQGQGWGMAPGFDAPVHEGLTRRVRRECMFCHNAYPEVTDGADVYGAPQTFPAELPEGTGCQRCHGPGAEHVARVFSGRYVVEEIRAAILNPSHLTPKLRNDVCYQCHMQPTVELMGVRRFKSSDYDFRPGESLDDYLVLLDAEAADQDRSERFEINHHPYRLEQSRCFTQSQDLSCLTCHDPHRKVPEAEQAAHYRRACLSCHQLEACGAQSMEAAALGALGAGSVDLGDCAACHMPSRRTQDVVHVAMTDHKIQRFPAGQDLLASLAERNPILVDLDFLRPAHAPPPAEGEIYRTAAVLRAGGGADIADRLQKLLAASPIDSPGPWLDLARARVQQRNWRAATAALDAVASRLGEGHAAWPAVIGWRAMAAAGEGRVTAAIRLFERALETGDDPGLLYNFGVVLAAADRWTDAERHLERVVELRPHHLPARFYLGRLAWAQDRPDDAAAHFRRALTSDPGHGASYLLLGRVQMEKGLREQALETWRLGLALARDSDALQQALEDEMGSAAGA
ncbi:MAG: tetratricopeptide repeat protein, partial [Acidobacteriota bacterium]